MFDALNDAWLPFNCRFRGDTSPIWRADVSRTCPFERLKCSFFALPRLQATRRALVVTLRSWAGVHLLASDSRGLVTLMRLLRDPSASFSEDAGLQDVRRMLSSFIRDHRFVCHDTMTGLSLTMRGLQ